MMTPESKEEMHRIVFDFFNTRVPDRQFDMERADQYTQILTSRLDRLWTEPARARGVVGTDWRAMAMGLLEHNRELIGLVARGCLTCEARNYVKGKR